MQKWFIIDGLPRTVRQAERVCTIEFLLFQLWEHYKFHYYLYTARRETKGHGGYERYPNLGNLLYSACNVVCVYCIFGLLYSVIQYVHTLLYL